MSRLRLILSAGACSIALSGCIPAAAGLALSAASIVTGGGGAGNANGFRNPIDKQSTGRQVKEALSRLDDRVDPACQAMLDERQNANAGGESATPASAGEGAARKSEPRNLLAKVGAQSETQPEAQPAPQSTVQTADVARSAEAAPAAEAAKPVKAALAPPTAAPGQCEHRLVCLPGTPKPTLMLMCPGKDGVGKDGKATVAGETQERPQAETASAAPAEPPGQASGQRQETAAAETAPADAPAPVAAPERGVADWNWAYDPARQL